jgi:RNA polymerase sigma-32 factor
MTTTTLPLLPDSFEQYMRQINQYEILDRDTEQTLARRYRDRNDLDAAQQLVCANLRFVVKVAREYRHYGMHMLDLVQEGNVGLMLAIKKFDPDRGLRLISYAVWWIRATIQSFIVRSWSLVRIGGSRAQKKLFFKLKQTQAALLNLTGEESIDTIADAMNVSEQDVMEMSSMLSGHDTSLDVELFADNDYTLLDGLADERINQEESLAERQESDVLRSQTEHALQQLNDRERQIVQRRILDDDPATLQELADHYAISRERVRQIEQNALRKIRADWEGN